MTMKVYHTFIEHLVVFVVEGGGGVAGELTRRAAHECTDRLLQIQQHIFPSCCIMEGAEIVLSLFISPKRCELKTERYNGLYSADFIYIW